jgi:hypothetical protein
MLEAYSAFHNYSFGNALLALEQCTRRNLQPGPLNTYNGWLERKRQVRKGEKGITLCMPMPLKRTAEAHGVHEETPEPQTPSGLGRIGLCSHRPKEAQETSRVFLPGRNTRCSGYPNYWTMSLRL